LSVSWFLRYISIYLVWFSWNCSFIFCFILFLYFCLNYTWNLLKLLLTNSLLPIQNQLLNFNRLGEDEFEQRIEIWPFKPLIICIYSIFCIYFVYILYIFCIYFVYIFNHKSIIMYYNLIAIKIDLDIYMRYLYFLFLVNLSKKTL